MILIVVQARLGSTRLPGKVLKPLAGQPLLARMVQRVRACRSKVEVVVATTTAPADDPLVELCSHLETRVVRGHPTDLLDRHLEAARQTRADVVVKIPSDCPLISPEIIDRVLDTWIAAGQRLDYMSNLHPPTYPDGNDVEVMSIQALETAWHRARMPHEREHTTPFIWERPDWFRLGNVAWETGLDYSRSHRLTIDYPEDYDVIQAIYSELCTPQRPVFGLADIVELLDRRPEIRTRNAKYHGAGWYQDHLVATHARSSGRGEEPLA